MILIETLAILKKLNKEERNVMVKDYNAFTDKTTRFANFGNKEYQKVIVMTEEEEEEKEEEDDHDGDNKNKSDPVISVEEVEIIKNAQEKRFTDERPETNFKLIDHPEDAEQIMPGDYFRKNLLIRIPMISMIKSANNLNPRYKRVTVYFSFLCLLYLLNAVAYTYYDKVNLVSRLNNI